MHWHAVTGGSSPLLPWPTEEGGGGGGGGGEKINRQTSGRTDDTEARRQTDLRQTHGQKHIGQTDKDTGRQTDVRQIGRQTSGRQTHTQTDRQEARRQAHRQTDGLAGGMGSRKSFQSLT